MKSLHRQKGLTGISIIVLLAMLAFFVAMALAVLPVYYGQFIVSSQIEGLEELDDLANMSDDQIMKRLMSRFQIDDVDDIKEEDIDITKAQDGLDIVINYEVRKGFIGNIDLVLYFDKKYEISFR